MIMPVGNHKGEEVHSLLTDYLIWLSENWEGDKLREEAEEELNSRRDNNPKFSY